MNEEEKSKYGGWNIHEKEGGVYIDKNHEWEIENVKFCTITTYTTYMYIYTIPIHISNLFMLVLNRPTL